MKSYLMPQFLTLYRALPEHVRTQARRAYALFQENPQHPSLRFRQVHPSRPIFSARVGMDYRAICIRRGEDLYWFWIGSHSAYDHLLNQL